jgi:lysophospholipase L1-like esterase
MYKYDIHYLDAINDELANRWPDNRTINIVCHGHSVPAGYFATPYVNTFDSYPHLLHTLIKERFPYAVVNVIVTAIGGENSSEGEKRFDNDVLCHKPDVLTIDYSLNDRRIGLGDAKAAWSAMIGRALEKGVKVILLTPGWDNGFFDETELWKTIALHAEQVRGLAREYHTGLADVSARFDEYAERGGDVAALLSHVNHPGRKGHELIAEEIAKYFLAR